MLGMVDYFWQQRTNPVLSWKYIADFHQRTAQHKWRWSAWCNEMKCYFFHHLVVPLHHKIEHFLLFWIIFQDHRYHTSLHNPSIIWEVQLVAVLRISLFEAYSNHQRKWHLIYFLLVHRHLFFVFPFYHRWFFQFNWLMFRQRIQDWSKPIPHFQISALAFWWLKLIYLYQLDQQTSNACYSSKEFSKYDSF